MYISAFAKGLGIGAGLIMPIGAQNAFVLKQGLTKNHVLITAALCSTIDAVLISIGVHGVQMLTPASSAIILNLIKWGGVIFLIVYGLLALKDSITCSNAISQQQNAAPPSIKTTVASILAISLLNPHVYLDTMVLIGSIGNQLASAEQPIYAIGAILASFLWFFSLAFGAQRLSAKLNSPKAWRVINFLVAIMMFSIAISLLAKH